ncbi:MAG: Ig-like domain-containing protein [Gemmatimonadaceae bacterium]|nr:Ig-like domain-containing protein [Gemmatimonadaceae bacterium]
MRDVKQIVSKVWRAALVAAVLTSCGGGDSPVTPPVVAGVLATVVASTVDSPLEIGQGTQATVVGRDGLGGAVALGSRAVTWSSSGPGIATITNNGIVAGIGVGSVTLTVNVQDGNTVRSATTTLVVTAIADAPLTADVSMAPQLFIPSQTVVKLGGTVRFQFTPIDHNVIWSPRLPGSPSDILVTTNALVSRTFPTVGVYPFDCTVHPGMSGRIIVSP